MTEKQLVPQKLIWAILRLLTGLVRRKNRDSDIFSQEYAIQTDFE